MRDQSGPGSADSRSPAVPPTAVRIEGVRPVLEALRVGRRALWEVLLPDRSESSGVRQLAERLREAGVRMTRRAGGDVVAWADPFPEEPFEQLLTRAPCEFLVALDRVTDVGNLGSIARSAETAGSDGLILEYRHAPAIAPGVLRASAGAVESLRVGRAPSLRRALELLRREGDFRVLAAVPGGVELGALDPDELAGPLVWVFGNEERGVRESVRGVADRAVGIPLRGRVESLGVAAAAAFLLHRTAELRAAAGRRPGAGLDFSSDGLA